MNEFKTVEFNCKIKMQVKITDDMTEEEKKEQIIDNFETVLEYGSNDFVESSDYSPYIIMDDIKNIINVKE
jgi:Uri superfamily endonuclease